VLTFDEVADKYRKSNIEKYKNCEVHAYISIRLFVVGCMWINKNPFQKGSFCLALVVQKLKARFFETTASGAFIVYTILLKSKNPLLYRKGFSVGLKSETLQVI